MVCSRERQVGGVLGCVGGGDRKGFVKIGALASESVEGSAQCVSTFEGAEVG